MAKYSDENVFCIYAFDKNGDQDPSEIARKGLESNSINKCPVVAADAKMAIQLFMEKYPDLMVAGVVNLADMKREVTMLEEFKVANEN